MKVIIVGTFCWLGGHFGGNNIHWQLAGTVHKCSEVTHARK